MMVPEQATADIVGSLSAVEKDSKGYPLLIVDDDEGLRTQLKWALKQDYEVSVAQDRQSALEIFKSVKPAVVTLDLGLPPQPEAVEEGFRTLNEILQMDRTTKAIVITGREEREHALEAISQGAYDYLSKPIQLDELKVILRRAFHVYQLEVEHRRLQQSLKDETFEGMLGTSPRMQAIFAAIRKVATTDVPVLIVGESGTGKELVARAIHQRGVRRTGPFIAINCGAIPEPLLESELFGHEKGAFTGAHIKRQGRIEMAQGGTLFLDEIGELSLPLQVKLLRFLQEREIVRVGGREAIYVDARVMAATNRDLKQALSDGRFRDDLYYRLGVFTIAVPPLRERGEDIPLLANFILQHYAAECAKKLKGFNDQALQAIQKYSWPGNVRELENRIKRAVIMAEGPKVAAVDLELASIDLIDFGSLQQAREALERDLVSSALNRNRGNLTQAAAELGVSRPTLYDLMRKLGIERG